MIETYSNANAGMVCIVHTMQKTIGSTTYAYVYHLCKKESHRSVRVAKESWLSCHASLLEKRKKSSKHEQPLIYLLKSLEDFKGSESTRPR